MYIYIKKENQKNKLTNLKSLTTYIARACVFELNMHAGVFQEENFVYYLHGLWILQCGAQYLYYSLINWKVLHPGDDLNLGLPRVLIELDHK